MLTRDEIEAARQQAVQYFAAAGIVVTEKEKQRIEIADFGLGDLYRMGLEVLVYINTERVCAKELVMFPDKLVLNIYILQLMECRARKKHSGAAGVKCIYM